MPDVPAATQPCFPSSCTGHVRARDGASAFTLTQSLQNSMGNEFFPKQPGLEGGEMVLKGLSNPNHSMIIWCLYDGV